ncbi:MAG: siphovirus ReqiPepy6 Gp37-like family protein [Candidatus Methanoculleus thermohydrogenotrophicum]|nr:siphovirus ReqiPepy6 Gp37-like family protein [Candidatus Methanoculleus thermohydrogenotrophicum]
MADLQADPDARGGPAPPRRSDRHPARQAHPVPRVGDPAGPDDRGRGRRHPPLRIRSGGHRAPGTYNVQVRILWADGSGTTLPASGQYQMEIGPALEAEDAPPEPLRVYDRAAGVLTLLGVIDAYEAIEWTRRWRSPGEWQAVINRYATGAEYLKEGRFVSLPRRGQHLVGRIETLEGQQTMKGRSARTGRSAGGRRASSCKTGSACMESRPGPGMTSRTMLSGRPRCGITSPSTPSPRPIPIGRSLGWCWLRSTRVGDRPSRSPPGSRRSRTSWSRSRLQSGLGWEISYDFSGQQFVFTVLEGADRSAEVLLSPRLGNCLVSGYRACLSDAPTLAVVAGQGEAADREIVEVGAAAGWDRREVFVDARDLDATDALIARGEEKLAEVGETTTLEVEYIPTPTYRYMTDFDLGDIVSAEYPGVATMQARIVTVTEQYPSGRIVLGLGKEWPDLISLVRALRKENAEMRR